jgi:DNA-binding transcriptional ArsR family regulator
MMELNELNPGILQKASDMLKAMAHPARIGIVSLLDDGKKRTVTEIHRKLGLGQAVASHHLVILRDRGVLSSSREGKNIYYYLRHPNIGKMLDSLSDCCRD